MHVFATPCPYNPSTWSRSLAYSLFNLSLALFRLQRTGIMQRLELAKTIGRDQLLGVAQLTYHDAFLLRVKLSPKSGIFNRLQWSQILEEANQPQSK